jgi:hypothetical protein
MVRNVNGIRVEKRDAKLGVDGVLFYFIDDWL